MSADLAMLGGEPSVPADAADTPWPIVTPQDEAAVLEVLRSGRLTSTAAGETEVPALEREWAAYTGVAHAAAVGSGTAALELALRALDIAGREVVVPALTMSATAHAVVRAGGVPVFADVDPETFNLSPASAWHAVGRRTAAILPVHLHGLPADMTDLTALANAHAIPVVEDAAQSHGATYRGRHTGALGTLGCFSLHPSKNLPTCGEGGLVTTASGELHDAVLRLRNFGEDPLAGTRTYVSHRPGSNARLGPIQAAFTRRQLLTLPAYADAREQSVTAFLDRIAALPGLRVPHVPADRTHAWHILRLRLLPHELDLAGVAPQTLRAVMHRVLRAEGVAVSQYQAAPLPAHPAFRGGRRLDDIAEQFPAACATIDGTLCLQRRHLHPDAGRLLSSYADAFEKVWEHLPVIRQMASSRTSVPGWRADVTPPAAPTPATGSDDLCSTGASTRRVRQLAHAVRGHVVRMAGGPAGAHLGGSLSCVDVLAALHVDVLTDDDRFVMSKGHAAPALYGLMAELGRLDPAELAGYAQPGSRLFGHPHLPLPGVTFATGSLGHGLGLAAGLAKGALLQRCPGRAFVLLGDGELQEGSVWESAMYAGHERLGNLIAIVDRNGLQLSGTTDETLDLEPLADRFTTFGWLVREVDGHDVDALRVAMCTPADRPVVVVAHTVKARGVPFLEGKPSSHYVTMPPAAVRRALAALERSGS